MCYTICLVSALKKQTSKWQVFLAYLLVRSPVIGPERKWKTWSLPSLHLYFHLASTYFMSWELEKPDRSPAAFRKFMVCSVVPTLTSALPGHRLPSGVSGSVGLTWGSLRICIRTGFPADGLAISVCPGIPH